MHLHLEEGALGSDWLGGGDDEELGAFSSCWKYGSDLIGGESVTIVFCGVD